MSYKGLIWQLIEYRIVPFSGTTDTLGRVSVPINPPFTDIDSIVPSAIGGLYKNRPITLSVVEVALDHVVLQAMRTKAPVANVLGAIVETFEVAQLTKIYVTVRGK